MNTNRLCICTINFVKYMYLNLYTQGHERWLCQLCFDNLEYDPEKNYDKNSYEKNEDLMEQFDQNLQQLKMVRENLIQHLHQLFIQYPFKELQKNKNAQEINQINTLFLDLKNNPFSDQELRIFDDLHNSIQNIITFTELTEQKIYNLLRIRIGHYKCDESKFQEILNFMTNIEDIESNNLVTSLKLIVKKPETSLVYSGEQKNQIKDSFLYISNKIIYFYRKSLREIGEQFVNRILAINSYNKGYCQFLLKPMEQQYDFQITLQSISRTTKAYFLCLKTKKIIRTIKNCYETIQYDQKSNQIIVKEEQYLIFQNISTLKIECEVKLKEILCCVNFYSQLQKVVALKYDQLVVYDIDHQNRCLKKWQRLNYYNIDNYHINQQYNFIVLISRDKIFILDQNFIQLKLIDQAKPLEIPMELYSGLNRTQVSADMKYLYYNFSYRVEEKRILKYFNFKVFKQSLMD
ncbi:hypothetical protein pb186bvf_021021 [Paramecium bursaria]